MPEKQKLERELLAHHPEPWVRHLLASFPEAYFRSFDSSQVSRHLEAMRSASDDRPVVVHVEAESAGVWRLDVVGYDAFQFLSTLCALLVVRELSILEGRVFTSQPPAAVAPAPRRGAGPRHPPRSGAPAEPGRRPRIVDVFHVRSVRGRNESPDWDEFRAELVELTRLLRDDKIDEVNHRLIPRFVAALGPNQLRYDTIEPIDVILDADSSPIATKVRIRGRDSFGFLSLTASALALCGIRIVHAEIQTIDERVDDTIWVTDRWGKKIVDELKLRELRFSLILIEEFSARLPRATDPEAALVHFSQFATETMARPDWAEEFVAIETPEVLNALVRILGESHFLWEDYLHAQPENILPMIRDPAQWIRLPSQKELAVELASAMNSATTAEAHAVAIRRFRDREVFRADMRSILGLSRNHDQFSAELADVAEVLLRAGFGLALEETADRLTWKAPRRIPASVLCALGKFGGRELGFGSDLEVMVIYDDRVNETPVPDHRVGGYFDSTVAMLRKVLGSREGHTFDLDSRLRPYGRAGSPATSFSTFIDYYRAGGPAWGYERQALIKLRVIAGDSALAREVDAHRNDFVYGPEPLDLEGLKKMRRLQVEQRVRAGTINAKYSPGALVDVEYFVQALQIVHGSHDPELRSPNTLCALAALGNAGHLTLGQAATLRSNYQFLRTLIDALRVVRDHAQDLTVPGFGTDEFVLLCRRMRAAQPEAFRLELERRFRETRDLAGKLETFLEKPSTDQVTR
jgi:[glutamine synthetase] adenylyltransferase / [glutamine synthetase]-adenylyl-L-tyrosine phosphorylase